MKASGKPRDHPPEIAARQAAADRRLERERKQAMVEYMVVVYVSFLVFLFIIAVARRVSNPEPPDRRCGLFRRVRLRNQRTGGFSQVSADAYAMLFYHATLVQGRSLLIAGQLSTRDAGAGTKTRRRHDQALPCWSSRFCSDRAPRQPHAMDSPSARRVWCRCRNALVPDDGSGSGRPQIRTASPLSVAWDCGSGTARATYCRTARLRRGAGLSLDRRHSRSVRFILNQWHE